jgi:hypothetical protein
LRQSMNGAQGAETQQLFNLQPWECGNLTLPLSCHGEVADGGRLRREARRKLKQQSGVNL